MHSIGQNTYSAAPMPVLLCALDKDQQDPVHRVAQRVWIGSSIMVRAEISYTRSIPSKCDPIGTVVPVLPYTQGPTIHC